MNDRANVYEAIERVRELLQDLERSEQHQGSIRAEIRQNLHRLEAEFLRWAPVKP